MLIYLPIAEMAVSVETIALVSLAVGFLSGIFGIGGGFLTTPFLIFLGIPPAVAVGTQTAQMVASSSSGVLAHLQRGNVDMKIGFMMLVGGVIGSVLGTLIFKILDQLGQIDLIISVLYILLLGSIGFLMLFESVSAFFKKSKTMSAEFNTQRMSRFVTSLPYKMRFPRSKLYISALIPVGIGFLGGLLASILGIGGGFLLVPAMIYILGMPTLLVTGTSLFQMVFTTAFATVMHAVANNTVDIMLAVVLITSGVIGAQFGFILSRYVAGTGARLMLSVIVLLVCFRLIGQLFIEPLELYSTVLF